MGGGIWGPGLNLLPLGVVALNDHIDCGLAVHDSAGSAAVKQAGASSQTDCGAGKH